MAIEHYRLFNGYLSGTHQTTSFALEIVMALVVFIVARSPSNPNVPKKILSAFAGATSLMLLLVLLRLPDKIPQIQNFLYMFAPTVLPFGMYGLAPSAITVALSVVTLVSGKD